MTKEGHDLITVFRKWELRYFVLNLKTKVLCYYTDTTYSDKKGEYRLLASDHPSVTLNRTRNPKKVMLEVCGVSRGGRQTLYLISPAVNSIALWYVGLRYAIMGDNPQADLILNWGEELKHIINANVHSIQAETSGAEGSARNTSTNFSAETQRCLARLMESQEKVMGDMMRLFDRSSDGSPALQANMLDVELSCVQRSLFPDALKCIEYARSWGLATEGVPLSPLRLKVAKDLLHTFRSTPDSLLRCHSIDDS